MTCIVRIYMTQLVYFPCAAVGRLWSSWTSWLVFWRINTCANREMCPLYFSSHKPKVAGELIRLHSPRCMWSSSFGRGLLKYAFHAISLWTVIARTARYPKHVTYTFHFCPILEKLMYLWISILYFKTEHKRPGLLSMFKQDATFLMPSGQGWKCPVSRESLSFIVPKHRKSPRFWLSVQFKGINDWCDLTIFDLMMRHPSSHRPVSLMNRIIHPSLRFPPFYSLFEYETSLKYFYGYIRYNGCSMADW